MFLDRRALFLLNVSLLVGCPAKDGTPPTPGPSTTAETLSPSPKARVRFKRLDRLAADLARALEIDRAALCTELDLLDCFEVHRVPLGGVEPYNSAIFEPIKETTKTTPMVLERIGLSACRKRAEEDLRSGAGLIFDPSLNNGQLDPNAEVFGAAIDALYKRFLQRRANAKEREGLALMYARIEATGDPEPGFDWAVLSCFAVATSAEALFY